MAGCHSKLSDQKFRNWIKATYAGSIAKGGLEDVVLNNFVEIHRNIYHDVMTEESSTGNKKCNECKTENILPCPTRDVCIVKYGVCSFHSDRYKQYRPCPNNVCDHIRDKIRRFHRFGHPSWKNTYAEDLCINPVEMAKCYLPRDGYLGVTKMSKIDLNGILSIMKNHKAFAEIVDQGACISAKALGNQFRHSPELLVSGDDLGDYLNTLIKLLTASDQIKNDKKAIEAVIKLRKLQAETLYISTEDVANLLQKSIEETTRCSLRDIAEKVKHCLEEALCEIRSSVASGISLFNDTQIKGTKRKNQPSGSEDDEARKLSLSWDVSPENAQHLQVQHMPSSFEGITTAQYQGLRERFLEDMLIFNSTRHANVPISPLLEKFDAPLLDFYVLPDLYTVEFQMSKNGRSEIKYPLKTLQEIFRRQRSPCTEIYLTADAGLGKTAFSKYLTLCWCYGHGKVETCHVVPSESDTTFMKSFDFVFLLHLRESKHDCDIDDMMMKLIASQLSRSYLFSFAFLQELLHREKCLVILDGLDEWTHSENLDCVSVPKCIPHRKVRERCTFLTTSRPWKMTALDVSKSQIHHRVEMTGLSRMARETLKSRAVTKVQVNGHDTLGGDIADFDREIKMNELDVLASIPMLLMYLVCIWCSGHSLGQSKCEMFSSIIELQLSRNTTRLRGLHPTEFRDVSPEDIPLCFAPRVKCREHFHALKALGNLAFITLFSARKETALIFDSSFAKSCIEEEHLKCGFFSGLLTQIQVPGTLVFERSNVCFTHKLFHEFLAALHIGLTKDEADMLETVRSVCTSVDGILEFSNVFIFLSGICPYRSEQISKLLSKVVAKDEITCKYRRTESFWDYVWVEEPLKRLQYMAVCCAKEHRAIFDEAPRITLEDFIIDRDCQQESYVSALKELAIFNEQSMKSLNIELEGIASLHFLMESFGLDKVHGIEHLLLRGECKNQDILHLVSKSFDTLRSVAFISRRWECDHFEGQLCTLSHKLGDAVCQMRRLEALHLNGFFVRHQHLKQLVSYIIGNNSMKEIILGNIPCVDHLNECHGFELDLSGHSLLRTLRLHNLPISQLKINVTSLEQVSIGQLPNSQTSVLTSYLRCLPEAKKLERFRCSFLESARDVDEVLKTLPSLNYLKDLRLHSINLGHMNMVLSSKMVDLEFIHLSDVTMSSSAFQALLKTLMGYPWSVMVVLVNCDIGKNEENEIIWKSIRFSRRFVVLFEGQNPWGNREFSFKTVNGCSE